MKAKIKTDKKKMEKSAKKGVALFQIVLMISFTFAISIMLAENVKAVWAIIDGKPTEFASNADVIKAGKGPLMTYSSEAAAKATLAPAPAAGGGVGAAGGGGTNGQPSFMNLFGVGASGASIYSAFKPAGGVAVWANVGGVPTRYASSAAVPGPYNTYSTEAAAKAALTKEGGGGGAAVTGAGGIGNFFLGGGKFGAAPGVAGGSSGWTLFGYTLARSATYAAIGYGVGQLIGSMFGLGKGFTTALSNALAVAGAISPALQAAVQSGKLPWGAAVPIGIAVVALVFILSYKTEKYQTITFSCEPWLAPVGGQNCEKCNTNPLVPCTEYRCKSLGQACGIVNPGTTQEQCAWIHPNDVDAPTIKPLEDALKPIGLKYSNDAKLPPALGVKISKENGECLEPFTPLQFGLALNEPGACKIDSNHTVKFEDMQYDFGETNYLLYNHTQKLRLPGTNSSGGFSSPMLQNDGTMNLYARCRDANGNSNAAEYEISFCVKPTPDVTPPIIEAASLIDGSPVMYNADNTSISIYVNEPAECKWSTNADQGYANMENEMTCANNPSDINADLQWICSGTLTGIANMQASKYYFKCKDINGNEMVSSYPLTIRGTQPLNMINIGPNGTIFGSTTTVSVDLTAETDDGSDEGKAICSFSPSGDEGSYTTMFETDSHLHKQNLLLPTGDYTYYLRCTDAGGNSAEGNTTFSVFVDKTAPIVTRAYKQEPDALKLVTNEDAECAYSLTTCNYNFAEGIKMINQPALGNKIHFVEWKAGTIYYIKCQDKYGNEPSPNDCSIIASPSEIAK